MITPELVDKKYYFASFIVKLNGLESEFSVMCLCVDKHPIIVMHEANEHHDSEHYSLISYNEITKQEYEQFVILQQNPTIHALN